MNELLEQKLKSAGLQENEARVYLALLELGKGTATQISRTAGLNRTTAYDPLERLGSYGLISRISGQSSKQIYAAEPPSRLTQFLEKNRQKAEEQILSGGDILQHLEGLYNNEQKPIIKFFEGRKGIKSIYQHALESKTKTYSFMDTAQYVPEFVEFGVQYVKARTKKKIKEYTLITKSDEAAKQFYGAAYANKNTQEYGEYRVLTHAFKESPAAEIKIYDDTVMGVLVKPGENVAFEIKNPSFANSLKIIFEIAWAQSKKL
tara:strand:+ start:2990 stop:3775 length:786 start_codon:yes stop_codon:yes gene_type:complete